MEQSRLGARGCSIWEGGRQGGEGDEDPSPNPTQSVGSSRRQETDRRACWEGFLSGRQRAEAADRSSKKSELALPRSLGDLGGPGGMRDHREHVCGGSTFEEWGEGHLARGGSWSSSKGRRRGAKKTNSLYQVYTLFLSPAGEKQDSGGQGVRRRHEGRRIQKKVPLESMPPGSEGKVQNSGP